MSIHQLTTTTANVTATVFTDQGDLITALDAQTYTAFADPQTLALTAIRQLREPADHQPQLLATRARVADITALLESMTAAAQAAEQSELAEFLGDAAEMADDLLILLARAAHGTLPAANSDEDGEYGEDREDDEDWADDEPIAA
ncbi:hypothetical protein OS965_29980 [Streptomyces sp. H27-G5]|uniref:hypothetical protein n=1 Tax=Streptomyces sp. H27-G5 TaxID=2996698 RepID=UPI00226FA3A5|nr:hypothetical protein [Streptomyces sp. H27-G5]MCY0922340.1 hypothetical protein [Streptomyces sp. H27-G5]